MKMLVANVGSSSFKTKLLDMPSENCLARAKVERIGESNATVEWTERDGTTKKVETPLSGYRDAITFVLSRLTDPETGSLESLDALDAVAFKPVYAKDITGVQIMDGRVLDAMAEYNSVVAPLHNPAYIEAISDFTAALPGKPMVGLFEDFFFDELPDYATVYPIPWDWMQKYGIKRRLFHSASHYFVVNRVAELMGTEPSKLNLITCHLGGSSSIQCIRQGVGVDGCGGFTLQNGVPMSVRPGDLDPFLVAFLVTRGEGTVDEVIKRMMTEGGLSAISGIGFDMRDLIKAADEGHERAKLAIDTYVHACRRYVGSWLAVLGHTDAITLAGGTGESNPYIRKLLLQGLEELGIIIDDERNADCIGREGMISTDDSRIKVWVIPTDEEIVVARKCFEFLSV